MEEEDNTYLASVCLSFAIFWSRIGSDPLTQVYTTSIGIGGHNLGGQRGVREL